MDKLHRELDVLRGGGGINPRAACDHSHTLGWVLVLDLSWRWGLHHSAPTVSMEMAVWG